MTLFMIATILDCYKFMQVSMIACCMYGTLYVLLLLLFCNIADTSKFMTLNSVFFNFTFAKI